VVAKIEKKSSHDTEELRTKWGGTGRPAAPRRQFSEVRRSWLREVHRRIVGGKERRDGLSQGFVKRYRLQNPAFSLGTDRRAGRDATVVLRGRRGWGGETLSARKDGRDPKWGKN